MHLSGDGLLLDLRHGLVLGSDREVGLGLGGSRRGRAAAVEVVLGLGGVVTSILLERVGRAAGVLASEILDLVGLGADDAGGVVDVTVNKLLVVQVDEGTEVDDSGTDEGKAPERKPLDEPVGEEGGKEGLE